MERVLASGPELAMPSGTMDVPRAVPSTHALPPEDPAVRLGGPVRSVRRDDLFPLAFHLVVLAALAASAYPGWRIGLVALAGVAAQVGTAVRRRKVEARTCLNGDVERGAWRVVVNQTHQLASSGLAVAVTGGAGSPLLVTLLAAWITATAVVGDRLQTRALLGATAALVVLLGLLPAAVVGPPLPGGVHALLTAAAVAGTGALLVPVHALLWRKQADLRRFHGEVAADALTRTERLEQIGSRLAHELKNPLTGVKALVQLGLRSDAEAASHERLALVDREVLRMQEILQNYLSFTRPLQGLAPRRVRLGPLVSDTLLVLAARADDAHVRLYAQGDATIEADPSRLKEALLNLVANAIEATPPGGEVAVEVAPRCEATDIVVRDTGRGMPAETLRRIGTPFFTTREGGTGLGVVLARSVVAEHGGSMCYESEPGKGTRVQVTLPREAARAAPEERGGGRGGPCARGG